MAEMSPADFASTLVIALLTFFNPLFGLILFVIVLIAARIGCGSWMYPTSAGLGFVLGYALRFIVTVVLGIAIASV